MRPDDILEWVKAAPFQPFKIVLNSGREYEIRHPEMVKVGRSSMHIFKFVNEENEVYQRAEMIGLSLIERIEPSGTPSTA